MTSSILDTNDPAVGLAVRKRERTRRQLAGAAADLFYEKGYDATTIDEIAAAAGVSPRTFFRYFPTKEDLVVALGETGLTSFLEEIRVRPRLEPLLTSLTEAVDASFSAVWLDTIRVRSFLDLLRHTPSLRARWLEEAHHNRTLLAAVIGERIADDADGLRSLLIAGAVSLAIDTALELWFAQEAEPTPSEMVHRALRELASPLLPDQLL